MLYNPSQIIINYPSNMKKILKGKETKRDEVNMLYSIKKHLKTIKREDLQDHIQAIEIHLVLDVVIHEKFKVPEFAKYRGV